MLRPQFTLCNTARDPVYNTQPLVLSCLGPPGITVRTTRTTYYGISAAFATYSMHISCIQAHALITLRPAAQDNGARAFSTVRTPLLQCGTELLVQRRTQPLVASRCGPPSTTVGRARAGLNCELLVMFYDLPLGTEHSSIMIIPPPGHKPGSLG